MKWHTISLWNLTMAIDRGGLKWWVNPVNKKPALRSRVATYDFICSARGLWMRRRYEMP